MPVIKWKGKKIQSIVILNNKYDPDDFEVIDFIYYANHGKISKFENTIMKNINAAVVNAQKEAYKRGATHILDFKHVINGSGAKGNYIFHISGYLAKIIR